MEYIQVISLTFGEQFTVCTWPARLKVDQNTLKTMKRLFSNGTLMDFNFQGRAENLKLPSTLIHMITIILTVNKAGL